MNRQHLDAFHRDYYASRVWQRTHWLGVSTVKYPTDLIAYQEIVWETKPDLIVECGTHLGGTAYFFATICELIGHGNILTIVILSGGGLPHGRLPPRNRTCASRRIRLDLRDR